jgi:DNA-binding beta-propeller fold protein YncE
MYGADRPVSLAVSPVTDRLYVGEMDGNRMIKMFDFKGNLLGSFAPPRTGTPERSPVYLAVSRDGRVFVSDRAQHSIYVYDAQGTISTRF